VADIIDRADVGRSTFYSHYTDKTDLLRDGLTDLRSLIEPPTDGPGPHRLLRFSLPLFRHAHEQRRLARALTNRSSAAPMLLRIEELLVDTVRAELASSPTGPVPAEATARYVVGAFLSLLAWWLNDDESLTPEEIDQIFHTLVGPGIRAVTSPPRP
jgi:AcrR family transcriptional regulator